MTPHRSEKELQALTEEAQQIKQSAEQMREEAEANQPRIAGWVETLKARRMENHFGRDFEITMRNAV